MSEVKQFNYYIDQKITCWERARFEVEANSQEEADAIAKQAYEQYGGSEEPLVDFEYESLDETQSNLEPHDNGGASTRELFRDGDGSTIADNGVDLEAVYKGPSIEETLMGHFKPDAE